MNETKAVMFKNILESCSNNEYEITVVLNYEKCEENSSILFPESPYIHVKTFERGAYNFQIIFVNKSSFRVLDVENMSELTNDLILVLLQLSHGVDSDIVCNTSGTFHYNMHNMTYSKTNVHLLHAYFWEDGTCTNDTSLLSILLFNSYLKSMNRPLIEVSFNKYESMYLLPPYTNDDIRDIIKEIKQLDTDVFIKYIYTVLDELINLFKADKNGFISNIISESISEVNEGNKHLGILSRIQIMTCFMKYINSYTDKDEKTEINYKIYF